MVKIINAKSNEIKITKMVLEVSRGMNSKVRVNRYRIANLSELLKPTKSYLPLPDAIHLLTGKEIREVEDSQLRDKKTSSIKENWFKPPAWSLIAPKLHLPLTWMDRAALYKLFQYLIYL